MSTTPMPVPQQQPQVAPANTPVAGNFQPQAPAGASPMPVPAAQPQASGQPASQPAAPPSPQEHIKQAAQKATQTLQKAATTLPQMVGQAVQQHQSNENTRNKQVIDLVANAHVQQTAATEKVNNLKQIVADVDNHMKEAQALPDDDPQKIGKIGYLAHIHADVVKAIVVEAGKIKQAQQQVQAIMSDGKMRKLLAKAVGYDEKQANSPERQMMIAALSQHEKEIQQGAKQAESSLPPPVPGQAAGDAVKGAVSGGEPGAPPQQDWKSKLSKVAETIGQLGLDLTGNEEIKEDIPGSRQHKEAIIKKANELKAEIIKQQQEQATTEETKAKTQAATLTPASQEEADAYGVPVGTMLNAATRAALAKQKGINETKVTTTGMTDQTKKDVVQLKPPQRDDHAIAILQKQQAGQPITADDKAYLAAYNLWTKETKIDPGIARAVAFGANRFVPVVDPSNPESVTFMRVSDAAKEKVGSPASIAFQTDKALTRAFTSGKPAETINYFNTATEHLQQLQQAADALNNGDVQAFNKAANAWATATGDPAPTNFATIKNAVAGELSKTFKGAAATDAEIDAINTAINASQSPAQLSGAIQNNIKLMGSKMDALRGQYEQGKQGKPNFPGAASKIPDGAPTATDAKGNKVYYDGKAWVPAK